MLIYDKNIEKYGTNTLFIIKLIKAINNQSLDAYCTKESGSTFELCVYESNKIKMPYKFNKNDFIIDDELVVKYVALSKRVKADYETYCKFDEMVNRGK